MARKKLARKKQKQDWALLIYIAGDNDLSEYGLKDIEELCKEGSSSNVHVGVEIDTLGEHTGSVRYEITAKDWTGKAHRTVIERLKEKDTGDPRTLREFLEWGLWRYPADKHLVVIWSHGSGFHARLRNVSYDDMGSSLDMPEIEQALVAAFKNVNKKAKKTTDTQEAINKIQILGFDACLMSMLEIVHHFRNQVEIIVGSQQTEPADGWPYDKVLRSAKGKQAERGASAEGLAKSIVRAHIAGCKKDGESNVTQSAIRTSDTPAVVDAVHRFGKKLQDLLQKDRDNVVRKKIRNASRDAQRFKRADYKDLVHIVDLLSKELGDNNIRTLGREVRAAVRKCVILKSNDKNSMVADANGISIWFPFDWQVFLDHRAEYMALKCNQDPKFNRAGGFGWRLFLDEYFYHV